jgi:hypothetical protein
VHDVPARIAQRVLHVPDQRVEPVAEVQRAIGPHLHGDGTEIGIRGLQQRLDLDAGEPRAVLDRAVLLDAVEPDDVRDQEVALHLVGEVAAADELDVARRPHLGQRPFLHRPLLARVIHMAGKRRPVVVGAARGVRDEVLPPAVDHVAPGIGERIGDEDLELLGFRHVTEHRRVVDAHRAVRRLDLRMVERAFLEVEVATGPPLKRVDGVMAVLGAKAVKDDAMLVGLVVAVGVAEKGEVRLLRDVGAAVAELEAHRLVEAVGEHGRRVRAPVAVGVFKDDDLVRRLLARQQMRIRRRRQHPKTPARVERDRDRLGDFGKLLLRGEEVDLIARRHADALLSDPEVARGEVNRAAAVRFLRRVVFAFKRTCVVSAFRRTRVRSG